MSRVAHLLLLDGVYLTRGSSPPVFRRVVAPGANELQALVEQIARRIGRTLEQHGRAARNAALSAESARIVSSGAPAVLFLHYPLAARRVSLI